MDPSPRRLQVADQLGVVSTDVARLVAAHVRPLLDGTGVDASAMRIMAEVTNAERHALRPSDLARLLYVDLSTISRQIRAATDAGLVTMIVDPDDRRASLIQLTEQGATAYADIRGRRARLLADLLDDCDETTIAQLATLLETVTSLLHPAASDGPRS